MIKKLLRLRFSIINNELDASQVNPFYTLTIYYGNGRLI